MAVQIKTPTGEIKSKPCIYDGRKFPSKTEARWAGFFDYLGITYDNPAHGVYSASGWLNPDFFLHSLKLTVEIKGESIPAEDPNSSETFRIASMRGEEYAQHTGIMFAILGGFTRHDYGELPCYRIRVYDPIKNVWHYPVYWKVSDDRKLGFTRKPIYSGEADMAMRHAASRGLNPIGKKY